MFTIVCISVFQTACYADVMYKLVLVM